jgi:hypothetical protein
MDRFGVVGAAASRNEARPDLARKLVKCDLANPECPEMRQPGELDCRWKQLVSAGDPTRSGMRGCAFHTCRSTGDRVLGKRGGNDCPGSDPALHIAFGHKLRVSVEHRET